MLTADLIALAKSTAAAHNLDPVLVCCVCEAESGWNPLAARYEDVFYNKYVDKQKPGKFGVTEARLRAFSFGLMQIMGQVARELGFKFDLPQLFDPSTNLTLGCLKLSECMVQANGDVNKALLKYNGGGNKDYPTRVLRNRSKYQDEPDSNT